MSNTFGYPSKAKCCICDGHKNNQCEPRFGYTVCEDHQHVPPVSLDQARTDYKKGVKSFLVEELSGNENES